MYFSNFRTLNLTLKKSFNNIYIQESCIIMKKIAQKGTPFSSSGQDQESYQVEKIVNHRSINGKKQYKVIWSGYSFEEATWQPEQNLKCPEKIKEFQKRYDQVIKKKKLLTSNGAGTKNEHQKERSPVSQKIVNEKPSVSQQHKPSSNTSSTALNSSSDRSQISIQKPVSIPPKKSIEIEALKSKIMNPQNMVVSNLSPNNLKIPKSAGLSNQNRPVISTSDLFLSTKSNQNLPIDSKLNTSKDSLNGSLQFPKSSFSGVNISKSFSQLQKTQNLIKQVPKSEYHQEEKMLRNVFKETQPNQNTVDKRVSREVSFQVHPRTDEEERKISHYINNQVIQLYQEPFFEKDEYQDIFMKVQERMEIEKITGIFDQGFRSAESLSEKKYLKNQPQFLLIKNRFNEKERFVQKERVIEEEPMKLIQYYESLLMESM